MLSCFFPHKFYTNFCNVKFSQQTSSLEVFVVSNENDIGLFGCGRYSSDLSLAKKYFAKKTQYNFSFLLPTR